MCPICPQSKCFPGARPCTNSELHIRIATCQTIQPRAIGAAPTVVGVLDVLVRAYAQKGAAASELCFSDDCIAEMAQSLYSDTIMVIGPPYIPTVM